MSCNVLCSSCMRLKTKSAKGVCARCFLIDLHLVGTSVSLPRYRASYSSNKSDLTMMQSSEIKVTGFCAGK